MEDDQKTLFNQIRGNDHKRDDECHMFFDWFCKDSSLERRAKPLMALLTKIAFSPRFDANSVYAFFKNNCPMSGSTYDQISICDMENDGKVLFCIQNRDHKWQVYDVAEGVDFPVVNGTKQEAIAWLMQ